MDSSTDGIDGRPSHVKSLSRGALERDPPPQQHQPGPSAQPLHDVTVTEPPSPTARVPNDGFSLVDLILTQEQHRAARSSLVQQDRTHLSRPVVDPDPRRLTELRSKFKRKRPKSTVRFASHIRRKSSLSPKHTAVDKTDHILNPARDTKNVVVEMELEIFRDLENDLEELSRLRQLGRYKDGRLFFERHLIEHLDNHYVFVQYAVMVLEQGDFRAFDTLMKTTRLTSVLEEDMHYLKVYVKLLKLVRHRHQAGCLTMGRDSTFWGWMSNVEQNLDAVSALEIEPANHPVTGTDKKKPFMRDVFLRCLGFDRETVNLRVQGDSFSLLEDKLLDCHKLFYNASVSQAQALDAAEVIHSMLRFFHPVKIGKTLFDTSDLIEFTDKLLAEWNWSEFDEATYIALLRILVELLFGNCLRRHRRHLREGAHLLACAEAIAACLIRNDPEMAQSQAITSLILARTFMDISYQGIGSPSGGLFLGNIRNPFTLPVFVPLGETVKWPEWEAIRMPQGSHSDRLLIALKTAQQLGDYHLQADCLRLLIRTSSKPWGLLESLAELQLSVHDYESYLGTILTGFLVSKEPQKRQSLFEKLTALDSRARRPWMNADLLWAESVIRATLQGLPDALAPSSGVPRRVSPAMTAIKDEWLAARVSRLVANAYKYHFDVDIDDLASRRRVQPSSGLTFLSLLETPEIFHEISSDESSVEDSDGFVEDSDDEYYHLPPSPGSSKRGQPPTSVRDETSLVPRDQLQRETSLHDDGMRERPQPDDLSLVVKRRPSPLRDVGSLSPTIITVPDPLPDAKFWSLGRDMVPVEIPSMSKDVQQSDVFPVSELADNEEEEKHSDRSNAKGKQNVETRSRSEDRSKSVKTRQSDYSSFRGSSASEPELPSVIDAMERELNGEESPSKTRPDLNARFEDGSEES